jgi:hypothetical protein
MAAVGISIVFTGLVVLSLAISQLHKVVALLEEPDRFSALFRKKDAAPAGSEEVLCVIPGDIHESARNFKMLVDRMPEPFSLSRLLEDAVRCCVVHPHSTLNKLIVSDIIVPDGEGYYRWNKNARI